MYLFISVFFSRKLIKCKLQNCVAVDTLALFKVMGNSLAGTFLKITQNTKVNSIAKL